MNCNALHLSGWSIKNPAVFLFFELIYDTQIHYNPFDGNNGRSLWKIDSRFPVFQEGKHHVRRN